MAAIGTGVGLSNPHGFCSLIGVLFPLPANPAKGVSAHSGDLERSIRSIMNTDSGDHEHLLALA
jgi:hypothetical protein